MPLCNRGETCAGETCHAHVCPAAEPRSLLPGDEWAMLTALSGPHPHREPHQTHPRGNVGITRAQGSQAGCRDGPQRRKDPGEELPGSPASATRPPPSWRSDSQALPLPTSAPAPHEAAVILTCHLNEKGERVEMQEEEEDVLILFSLPVSSMKSQIIQATKSLLAKSLLT